MKATFVTDHPTDSYREWQPKFARYLEKKKSRRKEYLIVGLAAEAAEVLGVLQKAIRKDVPVDRERVVDELGDTFWYLSGILNEFDISWEELTDYNINKLTERNKPVAE